MEKDIASSASATPGQNSSSQKGVRLFGVRLTDNFHHDNEHVSLMRKSISMGNLAFMSSNAMQSSYCGGHVPVHGLVRSESREGIAALGEQQQGYVSDGLMQTSSLRERKKGVPWTEEEHRLFLAGLQKLGKGDWRGISRNFVTSRTPTQVASHAQKYFLRQCNLNKRKRRSSLFDIISSNNALPTSSNVIDYPQNVTPTETTSEGGVGHIPFPTSCIMDILQPLKSPPPIVSPELCLGRPHSEPLQLLADNILSGMIRPEDRISLMNALLSAQLPLLSEASGRDVAMERKFRTISTTVSSSSSSSKSLSSSPSSSSSLYRIDETLELSSLSLSIGPPSSMDSSELTLKLEQPANRQTAFHSTTGSVTAVAGNTSNVTSLANAISVV